jgi:hypothetical protein
VKNFFLGVLTTLAVLVVAGFAYVRLGWAAVRRDLPPSRLETYLMTKSVHASGGAARRSCPIPSLYELSSEFHGCSCKIGAIDGTPLLFTRKSM